VSDLGLSLRALGILEGLEMKTLAGHLAEIVLRSLVDRGTAIGVNGYLRGGLRALDEHDLRGSQDSVMKTLRGRLVALVEMESGPRVDAMVLGEMVLGEMELGEMELGEMERGGTLPARVMVALPEVVVPRPLAAVVVRVNP
jgi:hypothetical protein